MIVVRNSGDVSLYNRKTDPEQLHDLTEERPDLVNGYLQKLSAWHNDQSKKIYCDYISAEPPEMYCGPPKY